MSIYELITLFGIMVVLAAIPSASVAIVVTRSATLGVSNGIAASAGIVLGDLILIALAVLGLTVVAEAIGGLFLIVKVLGGLYLLWFGFYLLFTDGTTKIARDSNNSKRSLAASFTAGFILTLGDIKAIVFYASLLPVFIDLSAIQVPDMVAIAFITILGVGGVKSVYAILASRIAEYAQRTNMGVAARKTAGGLIIGAGGYLIVKA